MNNYEFEQILESGKSVVDTSTEPSLDVDVLDITKVVDKSISRPYSLVKAALYFGICASLMFGINYITSPKDDNMPEGNDVRVSKSYLFDLRKDLKDSAVKIDELKVMNVDLQKNNTYLQTTVVDSAKTIEYLSNLRTDLNDSYAKIEELKVMNSDLQKDNTHLQNVVVKRAKTISELVVYISSCKPIVRKWFKTKDFAYSKHAFTNPK